MSSPSSLTEPWFRGVAANTAAPSGVLLRLLHPAARAAWQVLCRERALPAGVVDAAVAHPERSVRRFLARNHHATPAQRSRLLDDPDAFVRADLASGPRPRSGRVDALPDDVVETLLTRGDLRADTQVLPPWDVGSRESRTAGGGGWLVGLAHSRAA